MWALWLLTRRAGWIGTWDTWYIKQDICSKEGHLPHSQFCQTRCAMLLNGSDLSTDLSIAPFPIPLLKELEFGNVRHSVGRTGWASGRPCSIIGSDPNEHHLGCFPPSNICFRLIWAVVQLRAETFAERDKLQFYIESAQQLFQPPRIRKKTLRRKMEHPSSGLVNSWNKKWISSLTLTQFPTLLPRSRAQTSASLWSLNQTLQFA